MAKNKLPEGYKGVDKLIEEFRKDNPKGKIETSPVLLGDGYVIITATITKDDGAVGSGMADADVQEDKSVEKAESGAIRRAMLTLGYKSVEAEEGDDKDEKEEKEEKSEKRSFRRDDKAETKSRKDDKEDDQDDEEEEKEKPRSRFGSKNSERSEKRSSKNDDQDDEEEQEEGESKFKRGSRFQRN